MRRSFIVLGFLFFGGCALFSSNENVADLDKITEYDKKIQISEIETPPPSAEPPKVEKKVTKKAKTAKKAGPKAALAPEVKKPLVHLPELEDKEGFLGRRPTVEPFRIGEKVVLAIKYFGVVAGDLSLEVGKMVEVNGRKAYTFVTEVKSNSSFKIFYEVNDVIKTFVDYENLVPMGYTLRIRETNDTKEGRGVFDWDAMKALSWTKYVDGSNVKEEKEEYALEAFSQNVYSAAFYLRNFNFTVGKEIVFRVHDKGKTLLFKGQVLRKEVIETALGPKETFVIKPQFELDGIFKPVGDIYMWVTTDDRKFIVRMECKIKIGRIVGDLKSIELGETP